LKRRLAGFLALASLPLAGIADGHEYWLVPSRYAAASGDTIAIGAFVGTGFQGERKAYATSRAVRMTLTDKRTLDLTPAATNGDLTFARFVAADSGGIVVAYESNFAFIELAAAEFDDYLATEGLDQPLAERRKRGAGSGRERYARCAKTWIAGTDPARARRPVGLALELVALDDPIATPRPRFQLLHRGRPLAGTLVRTWRHALADGDTPTDPAARDSVGPITEGRTDRSGIVALSLPGAGEWLVSAVHMVPSRDPKAADWESTWASFTFARQSGH
jgi:uncharacterized GH25 family protein